MEQKGPQVNMDYSLDLKCFVNHQECGAPIMSRFRADDYAAIMKMKSFKSVKQSRLMSDDSTDI